jgi:DNA-binding transcriptional MerR regulator
MPTSGYPGSRSQAGAGRSAGLRGVDLVLDSLRRGHRQLARNPRGAIEAAVKQLLGVAGGPRTPGRASETADSTYRVDDLARAAGTTVRNIRAYQERGLLHQPTRTGRTALFDESHLSRLKIITSMLERGYTSAHIREMLGAWEHGKDLADVLGLERALIPPRLDDQPTTMSLAEARDLAGGAPDFDRYVAAGLIEPVGGRARVLRPKLLTSFRELREYGMATEALIKLHLDIAPAVDRIGQLLVSAGAQHLGPRFVRDTAPTSADVADLVELLTRVRTLAMTSVSATLANSIENSVETLLSEYLAHFVRTTAPADNS